ncbi:phosphohistidine phosphatase SixA [Vibrio marisflavi]|uniref:Phosphohistidine phosphatase SixA n=1 Tax=Vibrio marisflavi CECT 7928 TaxID=634439 RepID=A0ABM9A672_9VIBR|nr:phosphohistidine phosphatase SixA [Vibrio marisflavi]CAH0540780.1 Phosphohistidine phosphatase SixA [Vibrio marisflavi CECT 7928]
MKIYIMRHGEAENLAPTDAERALTERGRSDSISVAEAGVKKGFNDIDLALVSPYLRAQQTWQAISPLLQCAKQSTCEDITPYGESSDVFEYVSALCEVNKFDTVLLVSHLPLVGFLTSEFVPTIAPPMFTTSGLACIEFNPETRKGELLWHIHR